MRKLNWRLASMFTVLAAVGVTDNANAGGFEIKTRSPSLIGQANAGSAVQSGDITTITHNAAILSTVDNGVAVGGALIIPSVKFKNANSERTNGVALRGGNGKNAGGPVFVPSAFFAYKYTDQIRFGLGVTSPFGLETNYGNTWAGRYHATKSAMKTVNFNPMASYDCGNNLKIGNVNVGSLAVGAGVQVQYMDVELNKAVDTGALTGAGSQNADSFAKLRADSWGLGWNAGLLWKPESKTRIGLAFKSHVAHKLVGDSKIRFNPNVNGTALQNASAALRNQKAEASLDTPDQLTLSAWHDLTDTWSFGGDVVWTHWSRVKNVSIRFPTTTATTAPLRLGYTNTMFYALGANWKFNPGWVARVGVAYDQGASSVRNRLPAVPDSKRYWTAVGLDYAPMDNLKMSLNYAHEFVPSAKVNMQDEPTGRGNLIGKYDNKVDIIGATIAYKF